MVREYTRFDCADMQARYLLDEESGQMGLFLLPADMEPLDWAQKNRDLEPLVQLRYTGEVYSGGYAGGGTLRQSGAALSLRFTEQTVQRDADGFEVVTAMMDDKGNTVTHHLRYTRGDVSVECWSAVCNGSGADVTLELLSSFSLGGLTPFTAGDAAGTLRVHRIRSVWSMEGRLCSDRIEDLQLEPAWPEHSHAVRCERFGQVGSMPVNRYFPFVAVEDTRNRVIWGAQLAHNASWQMELYRRDDGLAVSGGLADREFGHWMKTLPDGAVFEAPHAILSVCREGGPDRVCQRLTHAGKKYFAAGPVPEQALPVIFNEYCTTWGCPSHENILRIVDAIRDKGISYFVIDAGWYKPQDHGWDDSMGDYEVSGELFPQGLERTVRAIRDAGMVPGIWFEIEHAGPASKAYRMEEHLLRRDGMPLATTARRFWDMRQPWVQSYLDKKVTGLLKRYGFGYMKMDYNDTIGLGCDGAESLGEGLRQNMEGSLRFIRRVKREIPGIILENCASGGHRLEPLMMSECSMASFSDAHECPEIPVIAANLHRTILPAQSQIWAVIRETDSPERIAYSVSAAMLGRLCLSGDVLHLSAGQWRVIEDGIAFYKKAAPVIRDGYSRFYGPAVHSYRHPAGWQAVVRQGLANREALAVIHTFGAEVPPEIRLELPFAGRLAEVYSCGAEDVRLEENTLIYRPQGAWRGVAVRLQTDGYAGL